MIRDFQGKGAFVTGAASGIGLAITSALATANMRVMLADIEENALYAALAAVCNHRACHQQGDRGRCPRCDVACRVKAICEEQPAYRN